VIPVCSLRLGRVPHTFHATFVREVAYGWGLGRVLTRARIVWVGMCRHLTAKGFDPLGFTKGQSIKTIKKWRESEVKHGRIAMLAVSRKSR
jgi:hypothetical protein